MSDKNSKQIEFGKFRLDTERKILWHKGEAINLPLKEIELLCVLTATNEIVTKDEILTRVWQDSFVEESNLSSHVYRLRKMFAKYGESENIIQTVPKRGYRFTGEVGHTSNIPDLVIEKHSFSQTLIEEIEDSIEPNLKQLSAKPQHRWWMPILATLILVSSVFGYYFYKLDSSNSENIKSIAILPLMSLSNDENEKALALGIKEKLLMNLGGLPEISVQNVSFDESQLDKITNTDAILLGNVQKSDGKIRVNLRFLRASDKKQIWSESFDENQTDLFKLQDAISEKITNSLALNLTKPEKDQIFKRYTENADAYELYLKGRYYWNKRNIGFAEEAETYFRRAIEKDPKFALAYVGLADKLLLNGEKDADFYLNKALEIEPNLAEAYASRGFLNTFNRWDWEQAESDFKKSIELNHGYGRAYQWYATLLMIRGRQPEAIAKLQRAVEIEPQSFNFYADLGQAYYFARDYQNAEKYCQKALEINPEFFFAHQNLTKIYLEQGEYEKWAEASKLNWFYFSPPQSQTAETKKHFEMQSSELMKIYHKEGSQALWKRQLEDFSPDKNSTNHFIFLAYLFNKVGDKEKALDNLEKAVEKREFLTPFINVEPYYDDLRKEPRFQAIIKKMNL